MREYKLNSECERFINYLTQQSKSPNTTLAYSQDLHYLFEAYKVTPQQITEEQIESFLYTAKSASTFNRRKSTYCAFMKWLIVKDKSRTDNPTLMLGTMEHAEKEIKHMTPTQMKGVKKAAIKNNKNTTTHKRDIAIVSTLMQCGLRESELRKLDLSDINFETGIILIRNSKGNKTRKFPAPDSVLNEIKDYIDNERKPHETALFVSRDSSRISRSTLVQTVKKYYNVVGCGNLTLHATRHSTVTSLLMSGKPLAYVSKLVGHSDPRTTMSYLGLIDKDLLDNKIDLL